MIPPSEISQGFDSDTDDDYEQHLNMMDVQNQIDQFVHEQASVGQVPFVSIGGNEECEHVDIDLDHEGLCDAAESSCTICCVFFRHL